MFTLVEFIINEEHVADININVNNICLSFLSFKERNSRPKHIDLSNYTLMDAVVEIMNNDNIYNNNIESVELQPDCLGNIDIHTNCWTEINHICWNENTYAKIFVDLYTNNDSDSDSDSYSDSEESLYNTYESDSSE